MGNNQHFTASKLLFGIFALFLTISTNAQCPSANANGMFDPESDILMTTYHSSIVKVTTGLVCWGEDLMPDGTADATAGFAGRLDEPHNLRNRLDSSAHQT